MDFTDLLNFNCCCASIGTLERIRDKAKDIALSQARSSPNSEGQREDKDKKDENDAKS